MGNIVAREKKDLYIEDPYVIEGPDGHTPTGKALMSAVLHVELACAGCRNDKYCQRVALLGRRCGVCWTSQCVLLQACSICLLAVAM